MKVSFRSKLMGSYLLLMLIIGGTVYGYLNYALTGSLVASIRDNLRNEANLAALMAGREISDLHQDAPRAAAAIGRAVASRVTIIAPSGEVVGDSEVKAADLPTLENHLNRPEVQEALKAGQGSAIRYSATLRTDMLYVAVPFARERATAVVRLALPLAALNRAKSDLHTVLGACLAFAFVLALLFSYLFSQLTSRPVRQIAAIAAEIGKGNFRRRLPAEWRDEFGELARVMNATSAKIEEQVNRLASERNQLNAILRGMGEGLMVTDATGVITVLNPAFCALFDVSEGSIGQPLIHITRHPALHEAFKHVTSTKDELQEEISIQLPEERAVRTHWVPLLAGNELKGIVAVFHDISDLKRLENVRKDFVANVSHELRTPVTVIKGYAETLLGGLVSEDPVRAARFIEIILNHAERLAALISDLLTLSEMESGDFSLQLQPLAIDGTIRRVCTLLEAKSQAKSLAVTIAPTGQTPQVLADQGRLEQVLVNLLDNAIKYISPGGQITIVTADEGDYLKISVRDTGPGIPPQSIARIFERFYRVDTGRSRQEGGTGLGLAIVKHIVLLHGGSVWVESTPGHGAMFSFTLKKAKNQP
jgi:two-component system, OmpR family, phosphate regulon sensor histidine kinase PhoR